MANMNPKLPGGRKPGIPNKTTSEIRLAISDVVGRSVDDIRKWLKQAAEGIKDADGKWVVKPDPGLAVKLTAELASFVLPTLRAHAVQTSNVNGALGELSAASVTLLQLTQTDLRSTLAGLSVRSTTVVEEVPDWLRPSDSNIIDVTPRTAPAKDSND